MATLHDIWGPNPTGTGIAPIRRELVTFPGACPVPLPMPHPSARHLAIAEGAPEEAEHPPGPLSDIRADPLFVPFGVPRYLPAPLDAHHGFGHPAFQRHEPGPHCGHHGFGHPALSHHGFGHPALGHPALSHHGPNPAYVPNPSYVPDGLVSDPRDPRRVLFCRGGFCRPAAPWEIGRALPPVAIHEPGPGGIIPGGPGTLRGDPFA